MVNQEETRKGPWTEQEDVQLGFYVNLFGDRRWDFIAKVSGLKVAGEKKIKNKKIGLKRTGKSCRLRWVNYMHPGLKRGKLSPQEERLVLQLHAKFGNRWSKIARKVPGRTDNDIKNYWRTHMRKEAQDKKKVINKSSSSSSLSCNSSSSDSPAGADSAPAGNTEGHNFCDTGGLNVPNDTIGNNMGTEQCPKVYSLDEIWKDITLPLEDKTINPIFDNFNEELGCSFPYTTTPTTTTTMITPIWDDSYYSNDTSLWSMNHQYFPEESNVMMMPPASIDYQHFDSFNICS